MKETIIKYLCESKISILIAVSWLTDKDILETIFKKSKEDGIQIKVLLSASDWNIVRYYEYKRLKENGVLISKRGAKISGQGNFMHCKFSVIDEKYLVHGSYNWTKLGDSNDENLEVIENYEKAREYAIKFHNLFKEANDFFSDLGHLEIESTIAKYVQLEGEGVLPDEEVDNLGATVAKSEINNNLNQTTNMEKSLEVVKLNPIEINTLSLIENGKMSETRIFKGALNLISFQYIDADDSSLIVSSKFPNNYEVLISNNLLRMALSNGNDDFHLLEARLAKFPSILLTILLKNRKIYVVAQLEKDNKVEKFRFSNPINDNLVLRISGGGHHYSDNHPYYDTGRKLLQDINSGLKFKEDIQKEFTNVYWL